MAMGVLGLSYMFLSLVVKFDIAWNIKNFEVRNREDPRGSLLWDWGGSFNQTLIDFLQYEDFVARIASLDTQ